MKKLLKISDLRKISKATGLDFDELKAGADWMHSGDSAEVCFSLRELDAISLYLLTRKVEAEDRGGETSNARALCAIVDFELGLRSRSTLKLVMRETTRQGRWMIAELNMGLDHLTLTLANPYASRVNVVAI